MKQTQRANPEAYPVNQMLTQLTTAIKESNGLDFVSDAALQELMYLLESEIEERTRKLG